MSGSRLTNALPNATVTSRHFEILSVKGNNDICIIFEKGRYLKGVYVKIEDSINLLTKLERLYPCHFLAKEWQIQ